MRPVIHSSQDVKKMMEEGRRARLISQIVSSPDEFSFGEFASHFRGVTRPTDASCYLNSYANSNASPSPNVSMPTYPFTGQSIRWSPHIEVSSTSNSLSDIAEETLNYNCRCEACTMKNCPSRKYTQNSKPSVFKDNIMTFSDRYTMTPRLNNVCCGVCTPINATPQTSDVCIAVRDTGSQTHVTEVEPTQNCAPILKKSDCNRPACPYGYCGHATGHVPVELRQKAVRDTDNSDDYCEPIKPKTLRDFMKFKRKIPEDNLNNTAYDGGRKIIYNEGISDTIANNSPQPPSRVTSPINVNKGSSKTSIRHRRFMNSEDAIPYSHKTGSKYHHGCKKTEYRGYVCDPTDLQHLVETPHVMKKMFTKKFPMKQLDSPKINLPRKLLTSELDIDVYVESNKSPPSPQPSTYRHKRSKRFFCK